MSSRISRWRSAARAAPGSPTARRTRRALRRHRRLVVALLCALAATTALSSTGGGRAATVPVMVAARDLATGAPLTRGDLAVADLPRELAPSGALVTPAALVGATLSGPVRRGEPITDVRLLGAGLLDTLPAGLVATPVRIADASAAALLEPGDRVDLLAAPADPSSGGAAQLAADGVLVLAVPSPAQDDSGTDGALLVLATTRAAALRLATAATADRLSVTLLPG